MERRAPVIDGAVNPMMNIERILCPIDLTPESDKALRYAAAIARAYKAKFFVCYCAEEVATALPSRSQAGEEVKKLVRRSLGLYEGMAETVGPDWESIILEHDTPAEAITDVASERGIDLIVMCSRRRPLRAALLGSTTESVYRTAPCPVLVVHPDQREWPGDSSAAVAPGRVLVATDFSDYSELALRQGLSLAQEYQAELHLLHVLSAPVLGEPELAWIPSSTEGAYHKAARRLQKAVPGEAYLWCEVKHAVRWGKPYREILSYAKEHEIDLICMGSQGTGFGMQALFGSNVDRVIRQSPCPALVARPLRPAPVFSPASIERAPRVKLEEAAVTVES